MIVAQMLFFFSFFLGILAVVVGYRAGGPGSGTGDNAFYTVWYASVLFIIAGILILIFG